MTTGTEIPWLPRLEDALEQTRTSGKLVLLDFSAAPMWSGCARLDAEVYPSDKVQALVRQHFTPARVNVRAQKDEYKRLGERYGVQWTPTILVLDAAGEERHRIEGFLPVDDFAAQLLLGLGKAAFARGAFDEAERRYHDVVREFSQSDAAAEALYWAGVSKYKATGDAAALADTARAFATHYTESPWAKKSSVWRS